jgi:hypothetical protein
MGTTKEWIEALFTAILWSGGMLLFRFWEGKAPNRVFLGYALGGLLVGLLITFGFRRAFSFPLVFVTMGIIVAALLIGNLYRLKVKLPS